eukprot:4353613-Pyramimonas_sp.AAC.1
MMCQIPNVRHDDGGILVASTRVEFRHSMTTVVDALRSLHPIAHDDDTGSKQTPAQHAPDWCVWFPHAATGGSGGCPLFSR